MTDHYGIIGWPVKHSLSPAMHNAGFKALNLDADYALFPLSPDSLAEGIQELRSKPLKGWNVTVPHKQAVMEHLDEIDPVAAAIGSVNTVVNREGKLKGYSTDGYGLEIAVRRAFDFDFSNKHVLFVGAGGAALACAGHFTTLGIRQLTVLNRTVSKAEAICTRCQRLNADLKTASGPIADFDLSLLADVDLVIQSTSIELEGDRELAFPFEQLPKSACVMDMLYHTQTPFIKSSLAAGLKAATGEEMLLFQGVKAFELWTEQTAPVDLMNQALTEAKGG